MRPLNYQKVSQMFLLQHFSAVCRNFRKFRRPGDITFWRVELTSRKLPVKYWITNLTHIKEQDGLLIAPVKIRFDETYLPICSKCFRYNITQQFAETSENWEASWYHILTGGITKQDGLLIVPRFDEIYQFAAGSANVSVTRFAERSQFSEGLLTSDIDSKTDRSETAR